MIENDSTPKRLEASKRVIALLIDLITCYITAFAISTVVSFVPFLSKLINQQIVLILLLCLEIIFFLGAALAKT